MSDIYMSVLQEFVKIEGKVKNEDIWYTHASSYAKKQLTKVVKREDWWN